MRARPIVTFTPGPEVFDSVCFNVSFAIDAMIETLLALQPDVRRLPCPDSALRAAMLSDDVWCRADRRIRDVVARLHESGAADDDLEELEKVVADGMRESAGLGFAVGLRVGRGPGGVH